MRYRRTRSRRRPYRRRTWARRLMRWFLFPLLAGMAAVLTTEAIDFVMLNLLARDVSGECAITRVVDGDTVSLSCKTLAATRGRIRGIDAPELFSASCISEAIAAQQAKWALQNLLWSAEKMQITFHGEDKYRRELITIIADKKNVAEQMMEKGHARRYNGGERGSWC